MTDTTAESPWMTVHEAAEHLSISRPTLFRWMREGKVSFYKLAGSTRFKQKDLDRFARKHTAKEEAEAAAERCAACGHSRLVDGRVQSTGRVYFRPEKARFWTLKESLAPVDAKACPRCGFIQMHANTDHLDRLLQEQDRYRKEDET